MAGESGNSEARAGVQERLGIGGEGGQKRHARVPSQQPCQPQGKQIVLMLWTFTEREPPGCVGVGYTSDADNRSGPTDQIRARLCGQVPVIERKAVVNLQGTDQPGSRRSEGRGSRRRRLFSDGSQLRGTLGTWPEALVVPIASARDESFAPERWRWPRESKVSTRMRGSGRFAPVDSEFKRRLASPRWPHRTSSLLWVFMYHRFPVYAAG